MRGGFRPYDPDSLLTGAEINKGFTYSNSHREYPDDATREAIISGLYKMSEVPVIAPRVFNEGYVKPVEKESKNEGFDEEYSI